MDNKDGGREKCCCPCCLGCAGPNCKGGFFTIGFCLPPMITPTDEGFDGSFFGIFAKQAGAPPVEEMER